MRMKDIIVGHTFVKTAGGETGIITSAEKIHTDKKGRPATLFLVNGTGYLAKTLCINFDRREHDRRDHERREPAKEVV